MTAALIASASAALATTMYATASCRFVVITFTSNAGGLEEYYGGTRRGGTEGENVTYKATVGLFQWLRPTDPYDWSQGSCAGYQETMLARISDTAFDVSRSFAIFAVMIALFQTCWIFLTACLSMNRIQGYLFCLLSFIGTLSTAMTFLFHKSAICQSEFSSRDCAVDEGVSNTIAGVHFSAIDLKSRLLSHRKSACCLLLCTGPRHDCCHFIVVGYFFRFHLLRLANCSGCCREQYYDRL